MDISYTTDDTTKYKIIYKDCKNCGGSGYVKVREGVETTSGGWEKTILCPDCNGTGCIRFGRIYGDK